LITVED